MLDSNRDTFIATLYSILLAPDLCGRLFSVITLMNLGNTCLYHKGFCTVYFGTKGKNTVTLPQNAQGNHACLGKTKQMSKTKKLPPTKKIALEFLHQRIVHRSTRSLLDGDTDNF